MMETATTIQILVQISSVGGNFITSWATDRRTVYCIYGLQVIQLIFAVLYVSVNDGPYVSL